eukprot:scaffold1644_cov357-Prasinococcus_capsulatus_cf.AAC.8
MAPPLVGGVGWASSGCVGALHPRILRPARALVPGVCRRPQQSLTPDCLRGSRGNCPQSALGSSTTMPATMEAYTFVPTGSGATCDDACAGVGFSCADAGLQVVDTSNVEDALRFIKLLTFCGSTSEASSPFVAVGPGPYSDCYAPSTLNTNLACIISGSPLGWCAYRHIFSDAPPLWRISRPAGAGRGASP